MNRVYKVVWNTALCRWVVASELAKNKNKQKRSKTVKYSAACLTALGLLSTPLSYAASCSVSTSVEFSGALNNANCTNIVLQNDITLTGDMTASFNGRQNIVVDGDGHTLIRNNTSRIIFGAEEVSGSSENLQFVMQNFGAITASNNNTNPIVWVRNANSTVDVVFNDINNMPGNMFSALGGNINSDVNTQLPNSYLVIGNIHNPVTMKLDSYKQLAEASKIRLTGNFDLTTTGGGAHARVFWSNSDLSKNEVYFTKDANVSVKLAAGDNFTSGGSGWYDRTVGMGFRYDFEDGAEFLLWGQQNVFGGALPGNGNGVNIGVKLGTYNTVTKTWGEGVKLEVAGVNGATLSGNGLANLSGYVQGIDNGPTGAKDVIFNLKNGSKLNVNDVGIYALKNGGNSSGIYLRSATEINAKVGIKVEHHGDGEVLVANSGTIKGIDSGVLLLSTSNNNMSVDNTGGIFNMSSGAGITVGTNGTNGNVNVHLLGGEINLSGSANGLDFSNSLPTNEHSITNTVINLAAGSTGQAFVSSTQNSKFTVKNIQVNLVDSIGFTDINNVTFALANDGVTSNQVNVSGAGVGVQVDKDLSQFANAFLDINVTNASGIGVEIKGGTLSDAILVSEGLNINAQGATALKISGTSARELTNDGVIKGNVIFNNGSVNNVIVNNGTINGTLTTLNGNDSLTLKAGSVSLGEINLGNGDNDVTIENGASFAFIKTGSGNDTFTFKDLSSGSDTQLGLIDAGSGSNTLKILNSVHSLGSTTQLQNFSNILLNNSTTLGVVNKNNIAAGNINISSDSILAFDSTYNDVFTATLSGGGGVEINNGANVTLQQANTLFAGKVAINQGAKLKATNSNQLGTASLKVNGTLDIAGLNTLNQSVTGEQTGVIKIDTSSAQFTFGASVGNQYQGTVDLSNSLFNLSGMNTTTLTKATLKASNGTTVTVGNGAQNIGGMVFNGGVFAFGNVSESQGVLTADNTITASSKIDATGSGEVRVNLPSSLTPHVSGNTLMQMDDGTSLVTLASGSTTGSAANIVLKDMAGTVISNAQLHDIYNPGSGTASAIGTFDYKVTSGKNNDGLYVSYGLTQVDLQGLGTNALVLTSTAAGNGSNANDLSAKVVGLGDLVVDTVVGSVVSLSNAGNTYTGKTIVQSGALRLDADSALGQTSLLDIKNTAHVDINNTAQTVQTINTDTGSQLNLNQGALTVHAGGNIDGALIGQGYLTVKTGTLNIANAQNSLNANVQIDSGSTVTVGHIGGLGTSTVNIQGAYELDGAQGTLQNVITGTGSLVLNNASNVRLTRDSENFSGDIYINTGNSLQASAVAQLGTSIIHDDGELTLTIDTQDEVLASRISGTGILNKEGSKVLSLQQSSVAHTGDVNINQGMLFIGNATEMGAPSAGQTVTVNSGATLGGAGGVNGKVINHGEILVTETPSLAATRMTPVATQFTVHDDLDNYGQIKLSAAPDLVGSKLVVEGDYQGLGNAIVHMNSVLGGDDSLTDQLVIQGHASGFTSLFINNVTGAGAETVQGIKVVDAGSSDAQAFSLANTPVAGAYEYRLYRNASDQDWYLTSYLNSISPSVPEQRVIRPDTGINTALQQVITNTMVPGLTASTDASHALFGRNIGKSNSLWTYATGDKSHGRLAGQISYDADLYTLNAGADTEVQIGDQDFIIGASVHLSHGNANAQNRYTNSEASGSTKGYSVGLYGTWLADTTKTYSPFVDVMLRYGYYKNSSSLTRSTVESDYHTNAWSFTAQGGYPIEISEKIVIEPQAQLTYVSYSTGGYHDTNGNKVKQKLKGHVVGRVGAYAYGTNQALQPYLGLNIWYDSTSNQSRYNEVQSINSSKRGVMYDAHIGVKSQMTERFNVWGDLHVRKGKGHYSNWGGSIGVKYMW